MEERSLVWFRGMVAGSHIPQGLLPLVLRGYPTGAAQGWAVLKESHKAKACAVIFQGMIIVTGAEIAALRIA